MASAQGTFRILHVLRAPVGGLFRHVCDLARAQAERGHLVGIVCDSSTGGARARKMLAALEPHCALGIARLPIGRFPGIADAAAIRTLGRIARKTNANVLHGHGAKGGAYARLARAETARRFYTPHGGSLHYSRETPAGLVYLTLEKWLLRHTDGLIFESEYGARAFAEKVGSPHCPVRVIHNGLRPDEFTAVKPADNAADLLFIGELRALKGIATFLEALGLLAKQGKRPKVLIVGDGAEKDRFFTMARDLGLTGHVRFEGAMPARKAFAHARIAVIPSHAESLPYIVLEAAAAELPLIATRVGGIPEIFGRDSAALVTPADPAALADAIAAALNRPETLAKRAARLRTRIRRHFSLEVMCDGILDFYLSQGK